MRNGKSRGKDTLLNDTEREQSSRKRVRKGCVKNA